MGVKARRILSQTYNAYDVPRYFKSRVALTHDEICHIAHFDVSKVERRPQYRKTLERRRSRTCSCSCATWSEVQRDLEDIPENFEWNMFRIIQKKTGNKAIVDIDKLRDCPEIDLQTA